MRSITGTDRPAVDDDRHGVAQPSARHQLDGLTGDRSGRRLVAPRHLFAVRVEDPQVREVDPRVTVHRSVRLEAHRGAGRRIEGPRVPELRLVDVGRCGGQRRREDREQDHDALSTARTRWYA